MSQVVYGSDIPYFWPDTIDLIVDAPFLSDADKEAILGGNLQRMLRIEALSDAMARLALPGVRRRRARRRLACCSWG